MRTTYTHNCIQCNEETLSFVVGPHSCGVEYNWVCSSCGKRISIIFSSGGLSSNQVVLNEECFKTKVLLRIRDTNVVFIADGNKWSFHKDADSQRYYYEEYTCPSNMFRSCDEVISGGIADEHDLLEYVDEIIVSGDNAVDEDEAVDLLTQKGVALTCNPPKSNMIAKQTNN